MSELKHTPLPWNLHASYNGEPILIEPQDGSEPWIHAKLVIAAGEKIIGTVEMSTRTLPHCGYPGVCRMAEFRANADLILQAVNNFFYEKEKTQ